MGYHVCDGDTWAYLETIDEAEEVCNDALKAARQDAASDGEWSLSVGDIAVHEGPKDVEDPSELPLVMRAMEWDVQIPSSALDANGYDDAGEYWASPDDRRCDYKIIKMIFARPEFPSPGLVA